MNACQNLRQTKKMGRLEMIMLAEVRHSQKDKYYVLSDRQQLIQNIKKLQNGMDNL